ncbi:MULTISPECIES: MOSC domain-containing protein [unclassified Haladaptatus]|uniref:MOSC domain-containing protein n=1 Tax=unclassified Haladaptatus TaxID=2622732 RepID=UPI0023E79561|nr:MULTISPECIES: MOSC domain-containing protein [unclassified Haladaptatus]
MSSDGRVVHIFTAPDTGDDMVEQASVNAVENRGIEGDRYYKGKGIWNEWEEDENNEASEITFIEAEAIEACREDYDIDLEPSDARRNVVTRGVPLNHLVGKQFTVGEAVCEGLNLCEPCGYMQGLVGKGKVAEALKHRGGLDARIVKSGEISRDDAISL